jgi:hypothetical protein
MPQNVHGEGPVAEIRNDPRIREAFFGGNINTIKETTTQ